MKRPKKFLVEGIDRLGKDTLVQGIQSRHGYHLVLHYSKPTILEFYVGGSGETPERQYQEASFRTMFDVLCRTEEAQVICNRSHLGECVYAPIYRGYPGEYVFGLEREFSVNALVDTRLLLLTEDFERSKHFQDDGLSLGKVDKRPHEQDLFLAAFEKSILADKRVVCVTNRATGSFRDRGAILDEALS